MVVAIIILFFVVAFVFCLHLYAKWFMYRRHETTTTTTTRRRRRLDFAATHQEITLVSALAHGLDPNILKTLPVMIFDPNEFKDGLECAVCLCEVSKGEKARLLPKCNHGFHLDCIDMWFQSHSTCPLCRNPVDNQKDSFFSDDELSLESVIVESPSFPTNVLFWGDESRVSTFGPCLDEENQISSGVAEPSSSSSTSSMTSSSNRRQMNEEDEQKSPIPTRLRSLKRLLSGNRRVNNPSSPRNLDLEQS
ncbi:RING-H2 finger protein atl60 [Phtheirospermum japonicum]|uniref:RING-type E3 ubiquitin transferase n=1 Tax=Phtheirospermum japonicum TaxID=374723 RepID=A0A830DNG4_9LAMI|nr:RING-H2 finger protein atl60 [Phtheirospermum japonicum]